MIDWKKLYRIVESWKAAWSWRDVGRELHMPASTFTRLKQGKAVDALHIIQICWATDTPITEVFNPHAKRPSR